MQPSTAASHRMDGGGRHPPGGFLLSEALEATTGIEPVCTDLQSVA